MNRKENELKDEKLRSVHGGFENIFKYYGIWDQLTEEEKELENSMIKRDRELADPSVPFETWLEHAQYQDKTERRILLKYGITNILVKYRQHFGSVAPTLEDAKSWWKYHCS